MAAPSRPSGGDHRMMEMLASARRVRGHFGIQLSGRSVVVERRAGAGVRRSGGVEAVGKDAAHRARGTIDRRARHAAVRRCTRGAVRGADRRPRHRPGDGGRPPNRGGFGHGLDRDGPRRRAAARGAVCPREFSNSAATTLPSWRHRPTSTSRCGRWPSPPWGPRASAAPRYAAYSCMRISTTA